MATIADRGCTAELVGRAVAETLVQEGLVDGIHVLPQPVLIQFGVDEARAQATHVIRGKGLIEELYVVEDGLPLVLISDITFTDKGMILVQDDTTLFGVFRGQVELVGRRDPDAPRTDPAAMWQLDLRALLQRPDPRLQVRAEETHLEMSAAEIVRLIQAAWQEGQGVMEGAPLWCAGARPTFTTEQVRAGRRILKCLGISPFTLAKCTISPCVRRHRVIKRRILMSASPRRSTTGWSTCSYSRTS